MIDIIITSYNEPKATLRAVKTFLNQQSDEPFQIIVCDPFPEVEEFLNREVQDKRVKFFLDPGEGKSYALNLLLEQLPGTKEDIFIFTDGDVYVSDNALEEIKKAFADHSIGCVTGKPVPLEGKSDKFGYWSHVVFTGIHKVRKKLSDEKKFFECSGYLFAIRKSVIAEFPLDVSEDAIIPYLFWKKGYLIHYLPQVEIYVKNPSNWEDWQKQKIRNIKGHENLSKLFPDMPRTKSFFNEIKYGLMHALAYPRNIQEALWTIELLHARLKIYQKAFHELQKKEVYADGWRDTEIASTKPLD
jgi:cellulose synthase/poly-beta-1,6-N-acetylglucosamine synthase-like glycosyltransferase